MGGHQTGTCAKQKLKYKKIEDQTNNADRCKACRIPERHGSARQHHETPDITEHLSGPYFGFAPNPVSENYRNFRQPQRITTFGNDLKPYLETCRLGIDSQQPCLAHREETGHGIFQIGQWPCQRTSQTRERPATARPIRGIAARHISAADDHIASTIEYRLNQIAELGGRMAEIAIHNHDNVGSCKFGCSENIAGQPARAIGADKSDGRSSLPLSNPLDGAIRRPAIGDQHLQQHRGRRLGKNCGQQVINIFAFVERWNYDRKCGLMTSLIHWIYRSS